MWLRVTEKSMVGIRIFVAVEKEFNPITLRSTQEWEHCGFSLVAHTHEYNDGCHSADSASQKMLMLWSRSTFTFLLCSLNTRHIPRFIIIKTTTSAICRKCWLIRKKGGRAHLMTTSRCLGLAFDSLMALEHDQQYISEGNVKNQSEHDFSCSDGFKVWVNIWGVALAKAKFACKFCACSILNLIFSYSKNTFNKNISLLKNKMYKIYFKDWWTENYSSVFILSRPREVFFFVKKSLSLENLWSCEPFQ